MVLSLTQELEQSNQAAAEASASAQQNSTDLRDALAEAAALRLRAADAEAEVTRVEQMLKSTSQRLASAERTIDEKNNEIESLRRQVDAAVSGSGLIDTIRCDTSSSSVQGY